MPSTAVPPRERLTRSLVELFVTQNWRRLGLEARNGWLTVLLGMNCWPDWFAVPVDAGIPDVPCAPVAPVGPVGPVAPVAPCAPTTAVNHVPIVSDKPLVMFDVLPTVMVPVPMLEIVVLTPEAMTDIEVARPDVLLTGTTSPVGLPAVTVAASEK